MSANTIRYMKEAYEHAKKVRNAGPEPGGLAKMLGAYEDLTDTVQDHLERGLLVDGKDLSLIAERVAQMAPPTSQTGDLAYVQGHTDALHRVERLLRWLANPPVDAP